LCNSWECDRRTNEEQIKSVIKKTLIPDIEALYQAITQALETITPDDARNSFLHRL
jgi:hypothetical protein